jgi:putative transposase
MNAPKCNEYNYINFLVAAQDTYSTVEASRTQPDGNSRAAHVAYTRLLQRLAPDSAALWAEVAGHVDRKGVEY